MTEAWIGGFKYFWNTTGPFDILEPYSTIASLVVGVPTFVLAVFVYVTLLRNHSFRGKAYFHIFIAQGFIDLLAYITNLLRYRLALFEPFGRFYAALGGGPGATTLCVLALSMPRAQLVAQCLLSTNRLLAVFKPLHYDRWQSKFSRCGFMLLLIVPSLVAIPVAINGFFVGAVYGAHGTIIFYTTANKDWPAMMKAADFLATAFQFTLTIFAFLCNCVLIVVMTTRKYSTKSSGTGLIVTTLAQFITHLAYTIIMQQQKLKIVCLLPLLPSAAPQRFHVHYNRTRRDIDNADLAVIGLLKRSKGDSEAEAAGLLEGIGKGQSRSDGNDGSGVVTPVD